MRKLVFLNYALTAVFMGLSGCAALGLLIWDFWFPGTFKSWYMFRGGMDQNAVLLLVFGLQHSLMSRAGVKRVMASLLTPELVRPTYVMWSGFVLMLLVALWSPMAPPLYELWGTVGGYALLGGSLLGCAIVGISGMQMGGLELLGWNAAMAIWRGEQERIIPFRTPGLYNIVRHPIYLGILLIFWLTPTMTHDHLFFAEVMTAYILVGAWFEERDLVKRFGEDYIAYQQRVPMLIPFTKWRRK